MNKIISTNTDYECDANGNIVSNKFGKTILLSSRKNKCGYLYIGMYKDGIAKSYTIHRLVALAFIPNPENKPCVNHINGIKTDNRIENLQWCTYSENIKHADLHNLRSLVGERNSGSVLKEAQILDIRSKFLKGIRNKDLAKEYETTTKNISKIILRQTWCHI